MILGEPTNEFGNVDITEFKNSLINRPFIDRVFISVVACTDDDSSMLYLNEWDRTIKNLDVVDDYRNERKEIRRERGHHFTFSYGDFVVKSLVGSVDQKIDMLDESKKKLRCCSIL